MREDLRKGRRRNTVELDVVKEIKQERRTEEDSKERNSKEKRFRLLFMYFKIKS